MATESRKVSSTVYLEEEQDDGLGVLAKKLQRPKATFIREGVDWVLAQYGIRTATNTNLPLGSK